jgi:tetratricopeptide (TPR) repeat protein
MLCRCWLLPLVFFPWLWSCGLLTPDLLPPSAGQVAQAKAFDQEEWNQLQDWVAAYQSFGLEKVEQLAAGVPLSVRQAVLLQDLRREAWAEDSGQWRDFYAKLFQENPSALQGYLKSRVTSHRGKRVKLLEEALEKNPHLHQARVEWLALKPFQPGDERILDSLLLLLQKEPGLAEAWRVLEDQAVRHGRWDLAQAALSAGHWTGDKETADRELASARYLLAEGRAELVLEISQRPFLRARDALFLASAALAELGQVEEARGKMELAQQAWPNDPWVYFNLGLLGRDYLADPELARQSLRKFLRLAEATSAQAYDKVTLGSRLQATSWLRELESGK